MDRRQYLLAMGVALPIVGAGCNGSSSSADEESEYTLGLYNHAPDAHTFEVQIGEDSTSFFHRETVELEGETADESIPFEGRPSHLHVGVDDVEMEFPWPAATGGGETIASTAAIYYDPLADQEIRVYGDS